MSNLGRDERERVVLKASAERRREAAQCRMILSQFDSTDLLMRVEK